MRIAHVTATFPPYYSGTGMVAYYSARELARRGHSVKVITAEVAEVGPAPDDDPEGVEVVRLRSLFRIGNAPFLPELPAHLKDVQIIHLQFPFYLGGELTALAARRYGNRLIVTYQQDVLLDGIRGLLARAHDRAVGARVLRSAERVLFSSLDYARSSKAWGWLDSDRMGELPNGVESERFHPDVPRRQLRKELGYEEQDVVFILVAALDRAHHFKGVPVLLRALARLDPSQCRVLIVGDGDQRTSYEEHARRLGVEHVVTFTGRVPAERLPLYYAAAEAGILPSTTRGEAFGMVLLEAMATGRPVIASDLPGVRTVVRHAHDGYRVQPGSAQELATRMRELASERALRNRMGEAARKRVLDSYTWTHAVDRLEKEYERVLRDEAG